MNLCDKPSRNPMVVLREEVDHWSVLFHPDTADAVGVNPVGAAIWKHLDGQRSIGEIVNPIRETFADAPESVRKDIQSFVAPLQTRGFAACSGEASAT